MVSFIKNMVNKSVRELIIAIIYARISIVYMIMSNGAWIEQCVNISAPRIRVHTHRCDLLHFPIEGVRAMYGESSPSVGFPFPLFSVIYGRYAKRSYGFMVVDRVDGMCFFLPFIFFSLFVESAMSRPLETYEPDRPVECVRTRMFFASNARESTRRTTLCSRVITEMKVPGKTRTCVCGRADQPDEPDDYINQTTTSSFLTLDQWRRLWRRKSLSRIRSLAIKSKFDLLKFGEM